MPSLHDTALAMLRADTRPLLDIHKDSGISFYWLRAFKAERMSDPGVKKVQALYDYYQKRHATTE